MNESSQTETGLPHNSTMSNTGDGDNPSRQHQQRCLTTAHRAPSNAPAEPSVQQVSLRKWPHSSPTTSVSRRSSTSTIHGIRNLGSLDEAEKEEEEEEKDGSPKTNMDPAFVRICSLLTHLLTDASIAVGGPDAEETLGARSSLVFMDDDGIEESEAMSDMDQDNLFVKEVKNIKNNKADSATEPALSRFSVEAEGGEGGEGPGERGLYKDHLGGGCGERYSGKWSWAASTSDLGGSRKRRSWSSRMAKGQSLFLELQQSVQANESPMSQDEATVHDLQNHRQVTDVREDDHPTLDSRYKQQDATTKPFDRSSPPSMPTQSAPSSDSSASWTPRRVPLKTPRRCASFPPNRAIEQIQNQERQRQHTEELQRVIERVESELSQTVETIDGLTRDLVAVATHQQWVHMNLQRNYYQRFAQYHNTVSAPSSQLLRRSSYFDSNRSSLVGTALAPRWTMGDTQAHERARSVDSWAEPVYFAPSYFLDEGTPFDCNWTNEQEDEATLSTPQRQDVMGAMDVQESMFLDKDDDIHPQDHRQQPSPGFFSGMERHEGSENPLSLQRQSNRFSKSSSAYTLVDESMSPPTHPLSYSPNSSCRNSASSNFSVDTRTDRSHLHDQKDDMDYQEVQRDLGPRGTLCRPDADQHRTPTISKEATSTNPEEFWVFLSSLILYLAPVNVEAPVPAPTPAQSSTPLSGMPTWTTVPTDFTATASSGQDHKLMCTDLTPPKTNKLLEQTTITTTVLTVRNDPDHQEKRRQLMARTVMTTTFQLFSLLFWTLLFSIATMLLAPPLTRIARRRILYTMDHIVVELVTVQTTDDEQQDDPTLYR